MGPARRIVPELISPSQASAVHPAFEAAAEQLSSLPVNLKEQAELAKTILEPGRKIYVDISQESKVNWRKASLNTAANSTPLISIPSHSNMW